ncbi:hypothetical protein BS17DRAFT_770563 [Gyrodon lividus]|nr:hypothetical protein BS17DRAFT_770563 [Gyrodon lividus]
MTPELTSHHTTTTGPKLTPVPASMMQAALESSPELDHADHEGVTQSMHYKQDLTLSKGDLNGNPEGNLDIMKMLHQGSDNSMSSTGNLNVVHRLHQGNDDLRSSIGNHDVIYYAMNNSHEEATLHKQQLNVIYRLSKCSFKHRQGFCSPSSKLYDLEHSAFKLCSIRTLKPGPRPKPGQAHPSLVGA